MRIADIKASTVVLMAGLLVIGGAGTVLVAANPFAINATADAPQLYNLTIQVGVVVEGKQIPIIGADVSVWSKSVNRTNDSIVITFTRVGHAVTETGGNVTFSLAAGEYIVVANYSGLSAIKKISIDSDTSMVVLLHNYHHGDGNWMCAHRHRVDGCHDDDGNGEFGDHGED